MRKLLFFILLSIISSGVFAQVETPVKWSYAAKKVSATEAIVLLKATIQKDWHIYSLNLPDGGPVKTSFTFEPSKQYQLVGKVSEPKPVTKYETVFKMNVSYFENSVIFQQKVKLIAGSPVVKGKLEYMTCNDKKCLPPEEVEFNIPVSK
jgi:hypothetical protein